MVLMFLCMLAGLATNSELYKAEINRSITTAWEVTGVAQPTAAQNPNSISGHVSDRERRPIPNLRVELLNEVDSVIQTVRTDGSGLFVFRRLSDGTFQVRVLADGTEYVSDTKRVEVVRTRGFSGSFEQVDFVLTTRDNVSTTTTPGVLFVQEVPAEARKQFQRGVTLLKKANQLQEGMAALVKAIELFPPYYEALDLLGSEYVKQQQFDPAIPVLAKAIEVNPRAFSSWYALALAQYNLKQQTPAIESLRHCVSLNPKSINAQLWLGTVLRQTGKLDEAETYLKKANTLAELKVSEAHWQLALLFNQLKRYREAADELEQFLKLAPDARDAELIKKLIKKLREQA